MGIEEVRDAVDALEIRRRLPPEAAPLPPPEPAPLPPRIRDDHRAALAPVVEGDLVAVEVVYRAGSGDVVEAVTDSGGQRTRKLFVIEDGRARPAEDIEARIDALPAPSAPAAPSPEPTPSPPPEAPAKKSRFGLGRRKEEVPPAEPAPAPETSSPKASKLKLPFGKKEKAAEPAPPQPEPAADEKPAKKGRFGLGFGKKDR